MLPIEKIEQLLNALTDASENFDIRKIRELLLEGVAGYQPQCDIQDLTFRQSEREPENVRVGPK
jgi:hypothetical protein